MVHRGRLSLMFVHGAEFTVTKRGTCVREGAVDTGT